VHLHGSERKGGSSGAKKCVLMSVGKVDKRAKNYLFQKGKLFPEEELDSWLQKVVGVLGEKEKNRNGWDLDYVERTLRIRRKRGIMCRALESKSS